MQALKPSNEPSLELDREIKREQRISALINIVLSGLFFLLVFGSERRALQLGRPDNFALDFFAQASAIALMSAIVPSLLLLARLKRLGLLQATSTGLGRTVALVFAIGITSAAMLAAACLAGPWKEIEWFVALPIKLAYGGALGVAGTTIALRTLLKRYRVGERV